MRHVGQELGLVQAGGLDLGGPRLRSVNKRAFSVAITA
jgi:hypothetical protein